MSITKSLKTADSLHKKELKLQSHVARWTLKLRKHQQARLLVALLFFISLLPLSVKAQARAEAGLALVLLTVFIFLVFRTKKIQTHVQRLTHLWRFQIRQKKRCLGQVSGRPWKAALEKSAEFHLIPDLGLIGPHSLWTLLDETLTEGGQKKLLQWMSSEPLDKKILQKRQAHIQKLRSQTWFYTKLGIDANSNELNLSTSQIQDFLKNSFVSRHFSKLLFANIALWILTLIMGLYSALTGVQIPLILYFLFPALSLFSLGSVGTVFHQGIGLAHHLTSLVPIFKGLEDRASYHEEIKDLCPTILAEKPSSSAQRLEFILGFLGTQTNPLLHFLLNLLMPWTLTSVYFLERHRLQIAQGFPRCLEELAEFEVLGSLLIFDRYQTQTYPQFGDKITLQCQQIFHPLLDRTRAVANDFAFTESKSLGLLTGSNMSGKSTFLRTLGINQILANIGAPVFADGFVTTPVKIETCIEVSDSLRDGYSYFYAEVRRLKDILQVAASKAPVLFLIDEIFRGTNNKERQIGSRAVIRTLAQETTALGFISTHDLELTTLEDNNPSLLNLHFRESIDDQGKMIFSYQLKPGPCPTTNALRIMAAEGIKVEEA
ncbi:MAG: DNA mismatch repair protein MutS [Bdellovibrio sp.]|nr:DNA mismatch repair protein MutS [Bdellovibrio sp.]